MHPDDEYTPFGHRTTSTSTPSSGGGGGDAALNMTFAYPPIESEQSKLTRAARGEARRRAGTRLTGRRKGGARDDSGGYATRRAPQEMTPAERDLRLLSGKASESYRPNRLDLFLMKTGLIKTYFFIIMCLSFAAPIAVLVAEEMTENFALYGRYVWRVTTVLTLSMTIPMWMAMLQWRPAYPMNAQPPPGEDVPTVDIAICTYKEEVGEIVDTIIACQRVEYAENMLHVYVLDDGHRADMKEVCRQLQRSDLLRHPLTYVDRPDNAGKKAGNINHWLREYEHESGEFFIILDADMQPFPDMLDILMGHFFGLTPHEQEICAFVQSPQFYRNFNGKAAWTDLYNISEFFFYRVLQPAMSHQGCTVYVGCCALWSRRAIESVGGFIGGYATEDSVTGCQVNRTLVPGTDYRWISKFVMQPVAAGLSPETLPALLEQRMRWYVGLCEMFAHHNGYLLASGLKPLQRVLFWVCSASYIANIVNYLTVFLGTMILLISISYYAYMGTLGDLSQWAFFAGPFALGSTLVVWSFIPGCTFVQFFFTMSTQFLYTPVYIAACLRYYCGIRIKVQTTAAEEASGVRRWHTFFLLPLSILACVFLGSIIALVFVLTSTGEKTFAPIAQLPIWCVFWVFVHFHVLAAMGGFHYNEISYFGDEAQGEFTDQSVKAHLARHNAMLQVDDDFTGSDEDAYDDDSEIMSSSAITGSSDSSGGEVKNPLTAQERREIAATLNFHLARRRAIAGSVIADQYAKGHLESDLAEQIVTDDSRGDDGVRFERRFLGTSLGRSAGARHMPSTVYGVPQARQ
jgi:cellulose synthase/poly-beta-1,6-N-acetylglucosamine synthase-like glycosyltransferase